VAISYLRSQLFRNASTLVSYTAVGYLASVIAAPVLTRLFSPVEFGRYGTFMAFPLVCGLLVTLAYDSAVPTPADKNEAANMVAGTVLISGVVSVLLSLVYWACLVNHWFALGQFPAWSSWLCFAILFLPGLVSVMQYWCLRQGWFHTIGSSSLITNVTRVLGQLGLYFLGWLGLCLGELLARVATLSWLVFFSRNDIRSLAPAVSTRAMATALWRQRRFPIVLLPPMAIDSALSAVALPVVAMLFGAAATGQYFLMKRILDLPAALVQRTIADAYYRRISEHAVQNPERVRPLLVRTFLLIVVASALGSLPLLFFGPSLFALVFGEPWREAGLLSAIMVPGVVVSLGASPVTRVFAVTQLPGLRYMFTIANLTGVVITLGLVWLAHIDLIYMVVGLSITQFISYSIYFASAYIAAGRIRSL
jgi:O-antigen/teichoic acid export membrane protein